MNPFNPFDPLNLCSIKSLHIVQEFYYLDTNPDKPEKKRNFQQIETMRRGAFLLLIDPPNKTADRFAEGEPN